MEPPAVDAGAEIADERHDRPLGLSVDLVAEQQEMGRRAERQVDPLPLERPPFVAGDVDLAAAGVVQAARQIRQRQLRRLAVAEAAVAEVRLLCSSSASPRRSSRRASTPLRSTAPSTSRPA